MSRKRKQTKSDFDYVISSLFCDFLKSDSFSFESKMLQILFLFNKAQASINLNIKFVVFRLFIWQRIKHYCHSDVGQFLYVQWSLFWSIVGGDGLYAWEFASTVSFVKLLFLYKIKQFIFVLLNVNVEALQNSVNDAIS